MRGEMAKKIIRERTHLKRIRQMAGYTQQEVADKLGVTKATISKYENGTRKINHAEELAKLYGVDLSYIYLGKNMKELRAEISKERRYNAKKELAQREEELVSSESDSAGDLSIRKYLEFTTSNPYLMHEIQLIGVKILFSDVETGKIKVCHADEDVEVSLSLFLDDR